MAYLEGANGQAMSNEQINSIGSIASGDYGELNTQSAIQFAFSEAAADRQFQRELDMWNMQNAYNDPSAMRDRFNRAGMLGQYLASGAQGAASAQSAGGMHSQTPTMGYGSVNRKQFNTLEALAMVQDSAMKVAELDNVRANTNLQNSQAITEESKRRVNASTIGLQAATTKSAELENRIKAVDAWLAEATSSNNLTMNQANTFGAIANMGSAFENLQGLRKTNQLKDMEMVTAYIGWFDKMADVSLKDWQIKRFPGLIAIDEATAENIRAATKETYMQYIQDTFDTFGAFPKGIDYDTLFYPNEEITEGSPMYIRKEILRKTNAWFNARNGIDVAKDVLKGIGDVANFYLNKTALGMKGAMFDAMSSGYSDTYYDRDYNVVSRRVHKPN